MDKKLVSVIIPCYNGEEFLAEAIESVLQQTYQNFELIAVDDGSVDNTSAIIKDRERVSYIYQENRGVAEARNTGLYRSNGDYIVFLDQDDRLLPHAIKVGVDILDEHLDYAFVYGRSIGINQTGERVGQAYPKQSQSAGYQSLLAGIAFCPPSNAIFRRKAFDVVGNFNPVCVPADDYDLYLRMAREFPIYCHNEIIVEYRKHKYNQSKSNKTLISTLHVLDAQRDFIKGQKNLEAIYKTSRRNWQRLFGRNLLFEPIRHLRAGKLGEAIKSLYAFRFAPIGLILSPVEVAKKILSHLRGKT